MPSMYVIVHIHFTTICCIRVVDIIIVVVVDIIVLNFLICFRFLLLCANCWVGSLRQSGLDTLGNISTELIIKVL